MSFKVNVNLRKYVFRPRVLILGNYVGKGKDILDVLVMRCNMGFVFDVIQANSLIGN